MVIEETCCYTRVLHLLSAGALLEQAIHGIQFDAPNYRHEGMAGFIETRVKIRVNNLQVFTNIWESWWSVSEQEKLKLYARAKGLA